MTWFRVWIEMNLIFVSGCAEVDLFYFRVGIKIDLTSMLGPTLTWLLPGGSKLTWF